MADATADWKSTLTLMTDAFGAGDNGRGEELLTLALDVGAPWDVATAAVAQALSIRASGTNGRDRGGSPAA
jgi:hypothetical protein